MLKKIFILIIFTFLLTSNFYAQVEVKTGVDKTKINIGDYFDYYIEINYDKNIQLILPPPGKELGSFDIKDYNTFEKKLKNKNYLKITYTLTTYFLGPFEIPSIEIKYINKKNNKQGSIKTEPLTITVVPVKRTPSDIDDIRDIKNVIYLKNYIWLYILIVIIILVAGILLYIYAKKYLKQPVKEIFVKPETPKPPHIIALKKIEALKNKNYLKEKKYKIFYFELNEILREYLNKRYEIKTLERTSFEIMRDLKKVIDNQKEKDLLKNFDKFFQNTDRVKFAKYKPTPNENKGIVDLAISLINQTKKEEIINNEIS